MMTAGGVHPIQENQNLEKRSQKEKSIPYSLSSPAASNGQRTREFLWGILIPADTGI